MKRLFALLVFGVFAFGDTIPVTGSGSFDWDFYVPTTITLGFSGSDSTGSVSFFAEGIPSGPTPQSSISAESLPTILNPTLSSYTQTIDGIQSNYFELSLGGGGGNLTLLDASGNVLISQAIQGYIQITDYEQPFGPRFLPSGQMNDNWSASGTFLVSPVPEARAGVLLCIGICFMVLVGRNRKAGRSAH